MLVICALALKANTVQQSYRWRFRDAEGHFCSVPSLPAVFVLFNKFKVAPSMFLPASLNTLLILLISIRVFVRIPFENRTKIQNEVLLFVRERSDWQWGSGPQSPFISYIVSTIIINSKVTKEVTPHDYTLIYIYIYTQSYYMNCNSSNDQIIITIQAGPNEHCEQCLLGLENKSLQSKRDINPGIKGLECIVVNKIQMLAYIIKEDRSTVVQEECIMQGNGNVYIDLIGTPHILP